MNYDHVTFSGTTGIVSSGESAVLCSLVQSGSSPGILEVLSGGKAAETKILEGGWLVLLSGGSAVETRIMDGGALTVYGHARATDITVSSGGYINGFCIQADTHFDFAVHVSNTTVGGNAFLYSGQDAVETTVTGHLHVYSRGTATGTKISSGGHIEIYDEGKANNTVVSSGGHIEIFSGGTAAGNFVSNGGHIAVYSGGTAADVTVSVGGLLVVNSGGSALRANVLRGGEVFVDHGGYAKIEYNPWRGTILSATGATVVWQSRGENVYIGNSSLGLVSKANTISGMTLAGLSAIVYENSKIINATVVRDGIMYVSAGGVADSAAIDGGKMDVSSGGIAVNTEVAFSGMMNISSGGSASNTVINSGGTMNISSGGYASNTAIITSRRRSGDCFSSNGENASNTAIITRGVLHISSGGVHRGSMYIERGASVQVEKGGVIDFSLSNHSQGEDALINNLSMIDGMPDYTISVSSSQNTGKYILAYGVPSFKQSITVQCDSLIYGSVSVDNPVLYYGSKMYSLDTKGGTLSLTISSNSKSSPSGPDNEPQYQISAPSGLRVSISKYNADLSWNKYQGGKNISYFVTVDDEDGIIVNSNKLTIRNLTPGTHTFQVCANTSNGITEWSSPKSFTVTDVTAPKTGSLTISQLNSDTALVSWTGATDNVGIDHYIVTCGKESKYFSADVSSAEFSGLKPGKVTASITAYDAAGNAGKTVKKALIFQDQTAPEQVKNLRTSGVVNNKSGGILAWDKANDNVGVTQYLITVDGKEYKSKTNTLKIQKLAAGTHTFIVVAEDKAKNRSIVSDLCSFEVKDVIKPTIKKLSVKVTNDCAAVFWDTKDESGDTSVKLTLDGNNISDSADFGGSGSYDLGFLSAGTHILNMAVYDESDNWVYKQVTFKIKPSNYSGLLAQK